MVAGGCDGHDGHNGHECHDGHEGHDGQKLVAAWENKVKRHISQNRELCTRYGIL